MAGEIRYASAVSSDRRPQGDVELRLHFYEDGNPNIESVVISYAEAFSLVRGLMGNLDTLADARMRSVAAGDCATCNNARCVFCERRWEDGTEPDACPDCDHPLTRFRREAK